MLKERRFFKENDADEAQRTRVMDIIKTHLSDHEGISFAYVHGSFAEGLRFRDIDVALFFDAPFNRLDVESDLSYELLTKTDYPVEVRIIND
ncbi:MAG: nucleotidyltransferase domain-containing protein, partial [Deltaproteobacteria bacterium]|nr:nucleotidyltransferase domain-containing protein [Deltaproteobacteria bacterium]